MIIYYTVYKITNLINQKTYIGKHQTKNLNDDYMGSGKLLRRAIKKYGLENFSRKILHIFDNEEEMNVKEKELVVLGEDSYNISPGGKGGSGNRSEETKEKIRQANLDNPSLGMKDKKHSEEAKTKISKKMRGRTAWNKGKKDSEETKTKKRKPKSEEHKENLKLVWVKKKQAFYKLYSMNSSSGFPIRETW
jgi:group I intron endonuclease